MICLIGFCNKVKLHLNKVIANQSQVEVCVLKSEKMIEKEPIYCEQ